MIANTLLQQVFEDCQIINYEICTEAGAKAISEWLLNYAPRSTCLVYKSFVNANFVKEKDYAIKSIMKLTKLSRSSVTSSIAFLVQYKIIERIQNGHKTGKTILNSPKVVDLSFIPYDLDRERIKQSLTRPAVQKIGHNNNNRKYNNKNVTSYVNSFHKSKIPISPDKDVRSRSFLDKTEKEGPDGAMPSGSLREKGKEMKSTLDEFKGNLLPYKEFLALNAKRLLEIYEKLDGDWEEAIKQINYLQKDMQNGFEVRTDPWTFLINAIIRYGGYKPNSKLTLLTTKQAELDDLERKRKDDIEKEIEYQKQLKISFSGDSIKKNEKRTEEEIVIQNGISNLLKLIKSGIDVD